MKTTAEPAEESNQTDESVGGDLGQERPISNHIFN